jgi:SAM-dependent methyltransferase
MHDPSVKRTAAAALRNRDAIAASLRDILPPRGCVLELGSGTGEHVVLFARLFPALSFQPSDPDPEARASIRAWSAEARLSNLAPPLDYDLRVPRWQGQPADALLCLNVLHVSPPECAAALLAGAPRVLPPGGPLAVYGPFRRRGAPLEGRLARIDGKLHAHDPALRVREREAFVEAAARHGLALEAELPMPEEGDFLMVFRRA